MTRKELDQPNILSVFCPNCGVPRTARTSMERYLKRNKGVIYKCSACRGTYYITRSPPKSKQDTGEIGIKDAVEVTRASKTIFNLAKQFD